MPAAPVEVVVRQLQRRQFVDARMSRVAKASYEGFRVFAFPTKHRLTIKRIERALRAILENHSYARQPVRVVTKNEMTHDVVRAPGARAVVAVHPIIGQPVEQCADDVWRAAQD